MRKILAFLFLFMFATQCGFTVIDTNKSAINIKSLNTEGYNKVNFLIKNDLIRNKTDDQRSESVSIKIRTDRTKEIAEKNIKNEITKYKITINVKAEITYLKNSKERKFNITKNGVYRVGETSLKTSNNLENLEKSLSTAIAKEIKQKIFILNNDI